ncbi:MAG: indole-3-glycerol phosphate synthase TrpC [Gammaproteobacteria bacterium]|nr:indole-3-glycerol phosphate synthase TrpC [Gammaproteobacteria bacterium]
MNGTVLDEIIAHKRIEVDSRKRRTSLNSLQTAVRDSPPLRRFREALHSPEASVIAEIKKASPSKGVIQKEFEPSDIAASYERHGAACLSVLTDERFFQGSDAVLRTARGKTRLPVLRKDFIVDEYQIFETRVLPADCLLLIVAALDRAQLKSFHNIGTELGLSVLVEVHDEAEVEMALSVDAKLIGINNRDLRTFHTDLAVTERLVEQIPASVKVVSESGIRSRADVLRILACGVNTFLVGEAFMRASDPGLAMSEIFEDRGESSTRDVDV